jgi:hypothetical protein
MFNVMPSVNGSCLSISKAIVRVGDAHREKQDM